MLFFQICMKNIGGQHCKSFSDKRPRCYLVRIPQSNLNVLIWVYQAIPFLFLSFQHSWKLLSWPRLISETSFLLCFDPFEVNTVKYFPELKELVVIQTLLNLNRPPSKDIRAIRLLRGVIMSAVVNAHRFSSHNLYLLLQTDLSPLSAAAAVLCLTTKCWWQVYFSSATPDRWCTLHTESQENPSMETQFF